jgi:hypothetical protein
MKLLKITKNLKLYGYRKKRKPVISFHIFTGYFESFKYVKFLYWDLVVWVKKPKKNTTSEIK